MRFRADFTPGRMPGCRWSRSARRRSEAHPLAKRGEKGDIPGTKAPIATAKAAVNGL